MLLHYNAHILLLARSPMISTLCFKIYKLKRRKQKKSFPTVYREVTWKSEGKASSINFGVTWN